MSHRDDGRAADPLPRPTPRQLVVRSIGTVLVLALLVAGAIVYLDQRDAPADVNDLVEAPRTVSYGRLSLQIPRDWTPLNNVDDCGHVQDDTLVLGNAGVVTCDEGQRDEEASDVVMSSLEGPLAAPPPPVVLAPVRLPSGLRGRIGTTFVPSPLPADGGLPEPEEGEPLRATVLRLPTLQAQVIATSRDQELVKRILETAQAVPSPSPATTTLSYLRGAITVPLEWTVNDVRCGIALSDTVIIGHPGRPRRTKVPGKPCPPRRSSDASAIVLDAATSDFGQRWGVLASDPVTLLDGVKAVRGSKQLATGSTVTVIVVPSLDSIAVARSSEQALVDNVLSTVHLAVPPQPDEEQTTPTPSPDTTARPTLPAGVKTRPVTERGITMYVPSSWTRNDVRCNVPQSNTVILGVPAFEDPPCVTERPDGVSDIVIERLYGDYGSLRQPLGTESVTLASGLSCRQGTLLDDNGLPVTVLAFPTLDVIVVATATEDDRPLMDGILATIRPARR